MSDYADTIKAVLAADGTLLATLTGGVFTWADAKSRGISRQDTPTAFDGTTKLLKPCCLLRVRSDVPDGLLVIPKTPADSMRLTLQVRLHADQDSAYTPLDTARARIYTLVQHQQHGSVADIRLLRRGGPERDPLTSFIYLEDQYLVYHIQ